MAWQGFDVRKFPRVDVGLKVNISLDSDNAKSIEGITKNIGIGGICVYSNKKMSIFDSVNVKLFLDLSPRPEFISCCGQVVWVVKTKEDKDEKSGYDIGIQFLNITIKDKSKIEKFIQTIS